MLPEYPSVGRSDGAGREDEFRLLDLKYLPPYESRHSDPVKEREHNEHRYHIGPQGFKHSPLDQGSQVFIQDHRKQNDKEHIRQRIYDIHYPHHYHIGLAAEVPRDRAIDNADDKDHDSGHNTDGK